MATNAPDNPDTLLTRDAVAAALTARGYPVKSKTLATKASRRRWAAVPALWSACPLPLERCLGIGRRPSVAAATQHIGSRCSYWSAWCRMNCPCNRSGLALLVVGAGQHSLVHSHRITAGPRHWEPAARVSDWRTPGRYRRTHRISRAWPGMETLRNANSCNHTDYTWSFRHPVLRSWPRYSRMVRRPPSKGSPAPRSQRARSGWSPSLNGSQPVFVWIWLARIGAGRVGA